MSSTSQFIYLAGVTLKGVRDHLLDPVHAARTPDNLKGGNVFDGHRCLFECFKDSLMIPGDGRGGEEGVLVRSVALDTVCFTFTLYSSSLAVQQIRQTTGGK
jgi:hypothetical protein